METDAESDDDREGSNDPVTIPENDKVGLDDSLLEPDEETDTTDAVAVYDELTVKVEREEGEEVPVPGGERLGDELADGVIEAAELPDREDDTLPVAQAVNDKIELFEPV